MTDNGTGVAQNINSPYQAPCISCSVSFENLVVVIHEDIARASDLLILFLHLLDRSYLVSKCEH